MRRTVGTIAAVTIIFAAVGGGYLLAARTDEATPSTSAGRAGCRAPRGTVLPVTQKRLRSVVVSRGTPGFARQEGLVFTTPEHAPSDTVTGVLVAPGRQVTAGQQVLRIGERPVFAIASTVPAYRDLRIGDTGADVLGVQQALAAQGRSTGRDAPATLGAGTARALRDLYESVGVPSAEQLDRAANPTPAPEPGQPAAATRAVIVLPRGEYVTVASLPATVVKVSVPVGAALASVDQPAVRLGSGATTVRTAVPDGVARSISVGSAAEILDANEQPLSTGKVTAVADEPKDDGDGTTSRDLAVASAKPLPPGEKIVRVVVADSKEPGLVVPLSAVVQSDGGGSKVQVASRAKEGPYCTTPGHDDVRVGVGVVSDGEAVVTPVDAGALAAGDLVLATA